MERNWLIRTFNKQILGPVSKQKLLEFIQKGSVGITDEVASGNGYWFSLKERDLFEKYLAGDIPQSFNPVSESKSVLRYKKDQDKTTSLNSSPPNNRITDKAPTERVILPVAEDLEYPDMTQVTTSIAESGDITTIASMPTIPEIIKPKKENIKVETLKAGQVEEQLFPQLDDLEYPDMQSESLTSNLEKKEDEDGDTDRDFTVILPSPTETPKVEVEAMGAAEEVKVKKEPKPLELHVSKHVLYEKKVKAEPQPQVAQKVNRPPVTPRAVAKDLEKRNDNYLFVIFFVLIIILFGVFYYYREILNKPLPI